MQAAPAVGSCCRQPWLTCCRRPPRRRLRSTPPPRPPDPFPTSLAQRLSFKPLVLTSHSMAAAKPASAASGVSEAPWSEKYRPRTLEEVQAHGDIIDTSASSGHLEWPLGGGGTRGPVRCDDCFKLRSSACCAANQPVPRPRTLPAPCPPHRRRRCRCPLPSAVKKLLQKNNLPHLLFYGPPGTGKTSTILAIARQVYGSSLGSMTLELNASDDRGIAVVRNEIQDFASTRTIFSKQFKLIILDECDAMTKDAQFALRRGGWVGLGHGRGAVRERSVLGEGQRSRRGRWSGTAWWRR